MVLAAVNAIWLDDPTGRRRDDSRIPGSRERPLAATAVTLVLLLLGTFVRASNSGLAFTDWPLMDGKLVPPPFERSGRRDVRPPRWRR